MILKLGDCLKVMADMPDNSVDSVVTDPPYGISFMNRKWDYDVPSIEIWNEVMRVLKPGGHLLSFAGSRTYHRMAINIEDAGFEIRDQIMWVYGSGFPKSHNISKGIESTIKIGKSNSVALRQVEQDGDGESYTLKGKNNGIMGESRVYDRKEFSPETEQAKEWEGWGTALKPAHEPIVVARKPVSESTVTNNVLKHGTGAINIDGCRIGTDDEPRLGNTDMSDCEQIAFGKGWQKSGTTPPEGRWPANIIFDQEAGIILDSQEEGAARFFYCPKASKKEKEAGLEDLEERTRGMSTGAQNHGEGYDKGQDIGLNRVIKRRNIHPTVKPVALMEWLIRLVTPPEGTTLDPFMGSGTTGIAATNGGFGFIGIEMSKDYYEIACKRVAHYADYVETEDEKIKREVVEWI
jgi:site-specific DNA-methyltransferase (adenine-specific)